VWQQSIMNHFTFLILALGPFSSASALERYKSYFPYQGRQVADITGFPSDQIFHFGTREEGKTKLTTIGYSTAFLAGNNVYFDKHFCQAPLPQIEWQWSSTPVFDGKPVETWGQLFGVRDCERVQNTIQHTSTTTTPCPYGEELRPDPECNQNILFVNRWNAQGIRDRCWNQLKRFRDELKLFANKVASFNLVF
jgi:hypothetical protein